MLLKALLVVTSEPKGLGMGVGTFFLFLGLGFPYNPKP